MIVSRVRTKRAWGAEYLLPWMRPIRWVVVVAAFPGMCADSAGGSQGRSFDHAGGGRVGSSPHQQ